MKPKVLKLKRNWKIPSQNTNIYEINEINKNLLKKSLKLQNAYVKHSTNTPNLK